MPKTTRRVIELDGTPVVVDFAPGAAGSLDARLEDGSTASVQVLRGGPSPRLLVDGRVVTATVGDGSVVQRGAAHTVRVLSRLRAARSAEGAKAASGRVIAPMPGRVVAVRVAVGQAVERGAALVVIEAMKMQNELFAPLGGTVTSVHVATGDAVERDAPLIEIA